jgi:hypothetical protein
MRRKALVDAAKVLLLAGVFVGGATGWAANGPSLDYLEENLNKVTYAEVVMEVGPPNKKEVLPDGSIIAMWSYDITQIDRPPGLIGGWIVRGEQYKMCRFDAKGILRGYKWKAGIIGGDSRENEKSSSDGKAGSSKKSSGNWSSR